MNKIKMTTNKKQIYIVITLMILFSLSLWFYIPNYRYRSYQVQESTSEHCSIPYPGKPMIQYAVMIDAGSSGSRVHIYKFNYCKEEPELEEEIFKMIEPGLSYYNEPMDAANSLNELLELAIESVPNEMHPCTPISLKATAGLRLLGEEKSKLILDSVYELIKNKYSFPISTIEIMEGKEEGIYSWITVNYLLGKFKSSNNNNNNKSVATFDLGGASTQIVYEPIHEMLNGNHKYQLNYNEKNYNLYQHSYLNYGLIEARKLIKLQIIQLWKNSLSSKNIIYYHPCLPKDYKEIIQFTDDTLTKNIELIGTGAGHLECRGIIEKLFKKDDCLLNPCSFNGVYQPSISQSFNNDRDLYLFSFFYDLTHPLGISNHFTIRELGELANNVCAGDLNLFKHVPNAFNILNDPNICLDLTYIYALLRIGYEIPSDRFVRTAKKIDDAELGWCLGASIAMIGEKQLCK